MSSTSSAPDGKRGTTILLRSSGKKDRNSPPRRTGQIRGKPAVQPSRAGGMMLAKDLMIHPARVESPRPMHATSPKNAKPFQSPTYPQRLHIGERRRWQSILDLWQGRVEQARTRLNAIAPGPKRGPYERLYFQMCG